MKHKNPGLAVDLILERNEKVLLIKRKDEPYKGEWAFPGGFINYGKETIEQTAVRELKEETALIAELKDIEFLGVASKPDRDPRGHVVAVQFVVKKAEGEPKANDDAEEAEWFSLDSVPKLVFDHQETLEKYKAWRRKNDRLQ
ncbi:hypothetical protein A3K73_08020 [Candidatus Pacearchaeota archaeon RBG_13_36_9]|nr:MAG: hypothetical protein A3K73_08020 [Candidatus Pacearchaeota archaeon RBG_13_36_9]